MAMNTMPIGGETRHEKHAFRSSDCRDILILLKALALEPCNMNSSYQRLQNRMLKVRKLLNANAERHQGKRTFNQYENDSKLASTFGLISREKYGNQHAKKQRRDRSPSLSCSLLFKEKWGNLQGTHGHVAFLALNDRSEYCWARRQDHSYLSDFDESIKGPNPMKHGNLKSQCEYLVTGRSCIHYAETSINEEPNMEVLNVLKSFVNEDFDESRGASHSLISGKKDMELNQPSKKFLPSRFSHPPNLVIPIGPRFQAEVPKWEGTTNVRHCNSDDLKWLGTQIWPMPDITETSTKGIGKGRSDSWTSKEQKEFESLVKLNPLSDDRLWEACYGALPNQIYEKHGKILL